MKGFRWSLVLAVVAPCFLLADQLRSPTIKLGDGTIEFVVGDQLVARYLTKQTLSKPHFDPINGPYGKPVTCKIPDENTDHPWQKAAWFCHGDVIPEGITITKKVNGVDGIDFWSDKNGQIVCVETGKPQSEKNHASIVTRNEWRTSDGQKILDENRTIHVYDLGASKLLTFDIDLHASVVPITFGDTKEGSFGVRVADSMTEKRAMGGVLENADGNKTEGARSNAERKGCWGMKSAWCDYSGPVDGKKVGIAIFDDPQNAHPTHWHARGYGLMAANPFGRNKAGFPDTKNRSDLAKLPKGEHLKLRYGIFVHAGDAKEGKVAEAFDAFVKLR